MSNYKYLVFSDVHFGHRRTPTDFIISNLNKIFDKHKRWKRDLDIIFIAGDLYDRRLDMSSPEAVASIAFMLKLIKYCSKYRIKLRILEGTPDHDWRQASLFSTLIDKGRYDVDYKYIDVLSIEHMNDLNIDILYIPDKWDTPDNTYEQVENLLRENGLSKVDLVIMHGQFHYQLPVTLSSSHNESDYIRITRGLIHAGHIHRHSVHKSIVVEGSFDRLAHNEEEPKGLLETTVVDNTYNWKFIENTGAKVYRTVVVDSSDIEEIEKTVTDAVSKVPRDSYIRFKVTQGSPLPSIIKTLRKSHPGYYLDYIYDTDKIEETSGDKTLISTRIEPSVSIQIGPDNIKRLLLDRIVLEKGEQAVFNDELKSVL